MYCVKCGIEIKDDTKFCSSCGNEIKQANLDSKNQKKEFKDKTKIKKTVKKLIIAVLVLTLAITSISKGVGFYLKQNGLTTYKCTYDDIEKVSKEICKNFKGGKAEIDEIKSSSSGDFYVYFNVSLSGKQKETVSVDFYNYKDSNKIGTIGVTMSRGAVDFHGENTYNCCTAIASAVEKTFLAWRYVDEYSDYSYVMKEMKKLNWGSDAIDLYNYTINDGPKVIISVDDFKWNYRLALVTNQPSNQLY